MASRVATTCLSGVSARRVVPLVLGAVEYAKTGFGLLREVEGSVLLGF